MNIDPASAALYALIALGPVSVEQRAAVLAGMVATLFAIAWRSRRNNGG